MVYDTGKMLLNEVRVVLKNPVNDVLVCQDMRAPGNPFYTMIILKDHGVAKTFLEIAEGSGEEGGPPYIDNFSVNGCFHMVFPFKSERLISDFYMGSTYSLSECESICINLVLTCLTCNVPWPVLYLMLVQGQVHLSKDHQVYLGYQIDMSNLDANITQKDCCVQCARILLRLLESRASQKAHSYRLLQKKTEKESYHEFTELYKDVRVAAVSPKRRRFIAIIKYFIASNRDTLFRVLLVICVVLLVVALLSIISQLIFGEVVWLRIFTNGFKKIGTQSLLQ